MFQIYVPYRNTILDKKIPHLNVFCALGAQLLPSFIQYHYYEVVLIHEGLIKSETLHLNKVLRPGELW